MSHTLTAHSVTDPVCGMTVDPAHAAATTEHGGKTFHFCAAACKRAFDAAPAKYAVADAPAASCCVRR